MFIIQATGHWSAALQILACLWFKSLRDLSPETSHTRRAWSHSQTSQVQGGKVSASEFFRLPDDKVYIIICFVTKLECLFTGSLFISLFLIFNSLFFYLTVYYFYSVFLSVSYFLVSVFFLFLIFCSQFFYLSVSYFFCFSICLFLICNCLFVYMPVFYL
jgi:hypothetical protein